MNFSQDTAPSKKRLIGIGVVILLHVLLIYALMSGLASDMIKAVQAPVEMQIIPQEKPVEPPKPIQPPKIVPDKIQPKSDPKPDPKPVETKPAPFVPKAEVAPPTTNAPKITTQSEVKSPAPDPAPPAPKPPGKTKGVSGSAAASCPTPNYPQDAQANEEQGAVRIRLSVGTDGHVTDAKVTKSSGSRSLDKATTAAYKQCVFSPALDNGTPTAGTIDLEYTFVLE